MISGRPAPQAVRDFATGLVLFCVLALPGLGLCAGGAKELLGAAALAHYEVREVDGILEAVLKVPSSPLLTGILTFASLAFAFASLFTLNLWLFRHVREVHVEARRGGRGRK